MPKSQYLLIILLTAVGGILFGCVPRRPVSTALPLTTGTPGSELIAPVITGGDVPLPLAAPVILEIRGNSFDVVPVEIQRGQWHYRGGHPDSAQWVYGTLVNYIIGLEATTGNTELLQSLSEADVIQLAITNGKVLTFQVSGSQWVEQDAAPDVFQQIRPGLTLVLLGDKGTKRLVVAASYVAGIEPTPEPGSELVQVGTPVQVGDARVTVLKVQLVRDAPRLPAGYAYYLVDFSVVAIGSSEMDAGMFQMDLFDGEDTRYPMSISASQEAGEHGPPGGQLEPGQALTATAGYLIPQTIGGPVLVWSFNPEPGGQTPARFQLALVEPVATPNPRLLVGVQVDSVGYSPDYSEIVVAGGIGNPTDQTVMVTAEDIVLESGGASVSLIAADPLLPWNIAPGESRAFTLRFPRLAPGTAILRILHWPFELSGLQ